MRFWEVLRAVLIPIILGMILLCMILALVVVLLTPEGLNPVDAVVLRLYLLRNNSALNTPAGTSIEPVRFEVQQNDTANSIGIRLVTLGIIENGSLFARYVRFEGLDTQLKAGVYFLSPSMTIPEIASELTDPTPNTVQIRVIEGWRMEQIADAIDQQPQLSFSGADFLAVVGQGASIPTAFQAQYGIPAGASLEGFLFPATYDVSVQATATEFRDQLLEAFSNNVSQQMINDARSKGKTMFEVVTLASIVEREAVLPSERPQIADVYLNRLEIGQKLQADPTTQYGIGNTRDGNWWANITQADYQRNDRYNTYVIDGLPPGPIANPSASSIRAVIYPADTTFFYFRAACDGTGAHLFSNTYEEHLQKGC